MKIISKFHIGMIRASALAVLNAINSGTGKAIIAKAAKLRLLAGKLNADLKEVLPATVLKVIDKVLSNLSLKALCAGNTKQAVSIDVLQMAFWFKHCTAVEGVLKSLVSLPKLPALR